MILIVALASLYGCKNTDNGKYLLIKGASPVNICKSIKDVTDTENFYILIKDGIIEQYGVLNGNEEFPPGTTVIDASGKYVMPGLIDGFAVQNNQAYANAYLYMGVTSIIGVGGGRRGEFFLQAHPQPDIYMLESVGDELKSTEEHLSDLQELYEQGFNVALLKYALKPDQVVSIKARAKELGIACIGELGYTSYYEGSEIGVEAFVHTTRYSLDTAPKEMAMAVAREPFSDDLSSPKWKYYQYLYSLKEGDEALVKHARMLGESDSYLMPTLSLLYLDLPEHQNPWDFTIAGILDEKDINNPADKQSGNHVYDSLTQVNYTQMAVSEYMIEKTYYSNGAKYLAGSATDVWGTMPGISLHTELQSLQKTGLSNREVLAAATSNFNKAFGWKIGMIENDFVGNLLILNKNPLDKLDNLQDIYLLVLRGEVLDREKLLQIPYLQTGRKD